MQALKANPEAAAALGVHAEPVRDFTYIVSHDLATEFRHVAEFSKLLRKDLANEIAAETRGHLDYLCEAAQKCDAMLSDVREYSRAQRAPLFMRHCSAMSLVDAAVLRLSGEINAASAAVGISVTGEIAVDETLFADVIQKLVRNALQFPRHDRKLHLEIAGGHDIHGRWRLRVQDNGRGLAPEHRERAFGMFWRLEPDRRPGGTGAGLAIVREIVHRHGGDVSFIDCELGACIELVLPPPNYVEATGVRGGP